MSPGSSPPGPGSAQLHPRVRAWPGRGERGGLGAAAQPPPRRAPAASPARPHLGAAAGEAQSGVAPIRLHPLGAAFPTKATLPHFPPPARAAARRAPGPRHPPACRGLNPGHFCALPPPGPGPSRLHPRSPRSGRRGERQGGEARGRGWRGPRTTPPGGADRRAIPRHLPPHLPGAGGDLGVAGKEKLPPAATGTPGTPQLAAAAHWGINEAGAALPRAKTPPPAAAIGSGAFRRWGRAGEERSPSRAGEGGRQRRPAPPGLPPRHPRAHGVAPAEPPRGRAPLPLPSPGAAPARPSPAHLPLPAAPRPGVPAANKGRPVPARPRTKAGTPHPQLRSSPCYRGLGGHTSTYPHPFLAPGELQRGAEEPPGHPGSFNPSSTRLPIPPRRLAGATSTQPVSVHPSIPSPIHPGSSDPSSDLFPPPSLTHCIPHPSTHPLLPLPWLSLCPRRRTDAPRGPPGRTQRPERVTLTRAGVTLTHAAAELTRDRTHRAGRVRAERGPRTAAAATGRSRPGLRSAPPPPAASLGPGGRTGPGQAGLGG